MQKYDFYKGCYLPTNGTIASTVLCELDLNCQVCIWLFEHAKTEKMQTLLLPSDRKSGICHRTAPMRTLYIDLHFQGNKFCNVDISKAARAGEK